MAIGTDPSPVREPAPLVCNQTAASVQIVIASCSNNLDWARTWAAQFSVLVLEQCTPPPAGAPGRVELVQPNVGREAHAYLYYIVRHWDELALVTVFLQGDWPRHAPPSQMADAPLSGGSSLQREQTASFALAIQPKEDNQPLTIHGIQNNSVLLVESMLRP